MFWKSILAVSLSVAVAAGFYALGAAPVAFGQTPTALAPCPTGVTLTVSSPVSAAPTTVSVVLQPAQNIKAAVQADPASLHVHYFIDTDPTPAGKTVPSGDPKIIHSGLLTQDLGPLSAGPHTVWVVLGQLDHTACTTRGVVTFNYAPQAAPAARAAAQAPAAPTAATPLPIVTPPSTGDAGLATSRSYSNDDLFFSW